MSNIRIPATQVPNAQQAGFLPNASVYVGPAGSVPSATDSDTWQTVYADGVIASQPIRTNSAGVMVDGSGVPKQFSTASAVYGLRVVDSSGVTRLQNPNAGAGESADFVSVREIADTSYTVTAADLEPNQILRTTSGSAVTITLPTMTGAFTPYQGAQLAIVQGGAGQVTVAGGDTLRAALGTKTRAQYSLIVCVSQRPYAAEWLVIGDATT